MAALALNSTAVRWCVYLLVIGLAVVQLLLAVEKQYLFLGQAGFADRQTADPQDLTQLAKKKLFLEGEVDTAQQLLRKALQANSLYVPAWLSLAELYNDRGERQQALQVLDYADVLTTGLKMWRWDKALTAYQLGEFDRLPAELHFIIQEIGGKDRNNALRLAFALWSDPREILSHVGRDNASYLLNYAVSVRQPDHALYFWQAVKHDKLVVEERDLHRFVDMLLAASKIKEAAQIWQEAVASEALLHNGDFSQPILGRAFGWRYGKSRGYDYRLEANDRSAKGNTFHLIFKGWENLNFYHFYQIVPLQGGRQYMLTGEWKSQKLTTDQRPFFEVYGYKCTAKPVNKTEMAHPDQEWLNFELKFGVAEDCDAVVLRLRRSESRQIDSKISGHLWLRNLSLEESADDYSVLDGIFQ